MSYNKIYFVKVQERTPRGLRYEMPTECFNDYREARKSLEEQVEGYRECLSYDMKRDEYIEDVYSGYENNKKVVELSVGSIIYHP